MLAVDQNNIKQSLKYLPIFIMASSKMLVLAGPSYFSRMWCAWELFVRSIAAPNMSDVIVWAVDQDQQNVADKMADFDLESTECFKMEDKEQIMLIVEGFKDGKPAFARAIKALQKTLQVGGKQAAAAPTATSENPLAESKAPAPEPEPEPEPENVPELKQE